MRTIADAIERIERTLGRENRADSDWDESKHKRAANGQFGSGGGSGKKSASGGSGGEASKGEAKYYIVNNKRRGFSNDPKNLANLLGFSSKAEAKKFVEDNKEKYPWFDKARVTLGASVGYGLVKPTSEVESSLKFVKNKINEYAAKNIAIYNEKYKGGSDPNAFRNDPEVQKNSGEIKELYETQDRIENELAQHSGKKPPGGTK